MLPDAPYHYACDVRWWRHHYTAVRAGYRGLSCTIDDSENTGINPPEHYNLQRYPSQRGGDFGEDCIHYGVPGGTNSAFQACNLAYLFGAKTILLLGIDLGGSHFFGDHPAPMQVTSPFDNFAKSFASITKDVEIINCTRRTALRCFPIKRITDLFNAATP